MLSTADAHGPIGRTVLYANCEVLPIFEGVGSINPTARLLIALLNPPSKAECAAQGLISAATTSTAAAARVRSHTKRSTGFTLKLLGSKRSAFGRIATASEEGR